MEGIFFFFFFSFFAYLYSYEVLRMAICWVLGQEASILPFAKRVIMVLYVLLFSNLQCVDESCCATPVLSCLYPCNQVVGRGEGILTSVLGV